MKEINFDGLVSPTHNYSGLAPGNLASTSSEGTVSRPREAALQGLDKMLNLSQRGIPQAFIPPQLRPSIPTLRQLGFSGSDQQVLTTAFRKSPDLFAACSSASSMWTANAATIAPSIDTLDQRVHFTPANLTTNFHRSIETAETSATLRSIFSSEKHFMHHPALPATPAFADEGAANHTRLAKNPTTPGLHLFVYGSAGADNKSGPSRFPARQTLESCQAIARLHQLPEERVLYLRQNPNAIDAGVFHNDVISVGHENVFLYHETAFSNQQEVIKDIEQKCEPLYFIPVPDSEVSLAKAVETYLFNSQIVTLPEGNMLMLCPTECRDDKGVSKFIEKKIVGGENPISEVIYQDLKQSMRNGGGPACLRLRVPLTDAEKQSISLRIFLNDESERFLRDWINHHYPETLKLEELADFDRYQKTESALKELRSWIGL